MTEDGTVWCCGFNLEGQLGDGTTTDRISRSSFFNYRCDIYVGMSTARAAVNQRKDLKCWGDNFVGDGSSTDSATPVNVTEINGWGSDYTFDGVASGQSSTCAYNKENNQVYCWGVNAED